MLKDGEPSKFAQRMRAIFAMLRAAGVSFVTSTDAGIPNVAHHRLAEGMIAFAALSELRAVDVLRAATSDAARALGIEQTTGRLEAGLAADILLTDGDPTTDLAALQTPRLVIARGQVVTPAAHPDDPQAAPERRAP